MNPRRLPIPSRRSRHLPGGAMPPRDARSLYAPWEFWAHFGVVVLVPIMLASVSDGFLGRAEEFKQRNVPIGSSVGDPSPRGAGCPPYVGGSGCEEAER